MHILTLLVALETGPGPPGAGPNMSLSWSRSLVSVFFGPSGSPAINLNVLMHSFDIDFYKLQCKLYNEATSDLSLTITG